MFLLVERWFVNRHEWVKLRLRMVSYKDIREGSSRFWLKRDSPPSFSSAQIQNILPPPPNLELVFFKLPSCTPTHTTHHTQKSLAQQSISLISLLNQLWLSTDSDFKPHIHHPTTSRLDSNSLKIDSYLSESRLSIIIYSFDHLDLVSTFNR